MLDIDLAFWVKGTKAGQKRRVVFYRSRENRVYPGPNLEQQHMNPSPQC